MARREETNAEKGFTLLEVLIAMSILAVGAASILSIFVWAITFHTKRVEDNRLQGVYNHALEHARVKFNEFDPGAVPPGQPLLPAPVVVDLTGPGRPETTDMMVVDAWEKYRGFQYKITFEDNDLAVPGSSVVVDIEIRGLSGEIDDSSHKWFLSRTNAPARERFRSPSMEEREAKGEKPRGP